MTETERRVKEFLCKELPISPSEVTRRSRLWEDLQLRGDDAWDLFENFVKKFSVDMSGFEFSDYFRGESTDPLLMLWNLMIGRKWKTVTVGDLIRWAEAGKWDGDRAGDDRS